MARVDGRANDEMRQVVMRPGYLDYAEGSVLIEMGGTRVLCAASVEESVPPWRTGSGCGWVTAEYALLPRSTHTRTRRESVAGHIGGRTHEISRLIGRSLRAAFDLLLLGERTITVDCDVIQADGGTRTASVTGAYVAVAIALSRLIEGGQAPLGALRYPVAAISVGMLDGVPLLDLCYAEDSRADVDINVVMVKGGRLVEVQGTAEGQPFSRSDLDDMLDLADLGIRNLLEQQARVLAPYHG